MEAVGLIIPCSTRTGSVKSVVGSGVIIEYLAGDEVYIEFDQMIYFGESSSDGKDLRAECGVGRKLSVAADAIGDVPVKCIRFLD